MLVKKMDVTQYRVGGGEVCVWEELKSGGTVQSVR